MYQDITQNSPHDPRALVSNGTPFHGPSESLGQELVPHCRVILSSHQGVGRFYPGNIIRLARKREKRQARSRVLRGSLASLPITLAPKSDTACWKGQTAVPDGVCVEHVLLCLEDTYFSLPAWPER